MKHFFTLTFLAAVVSPLAAETDVSGWYRGNTHTHTLWSDGNDFPEMVVDWYHQRGYQFIALSDHDILAEGDKTMSVKAIKKRQRALGTGAISKLEARFGSDWIERVKVGEEEHIKLKTLEEFRGQFEKPGEFAIIKAEEISNQSRSGPVHMNALNLEVKIPSIKDKKLSAIAVMRQAFARVAAQEKEIGRPILTHLNHPNFQWAITAEELAEVVEERYFEVYNGHPGINHLGDKTRPGDEKIWDIANTIRLQSKGAAPLFGVATDDSHTYHGGDVSPGRGWIVVGAESLDGTALVEAMRAGRFYASSGVALQTLDFDPDSRTLSFSIKTVEGESYRTEFIGTRRDASEDKVGEVFATQEGAKASFVVPDDALYLRATITSSAAHTNPSFPDQKKQAWIQPVGWSVAESDEE